MRLRVKRVIAVIAIILIIIYVIYVVISNNIKNKSNGAQQIETSIQYSKEIRLGVSNFDTINPLLTNNKEMVNINKLVFEPLFNLDGEYRLTPCLATEVAKIDNKTYIVKINTSAKWSDGNQVSSSDVVYTVNNLKKINSVYSVNVRNILEIEAIDESTIKIQLNNEEMFFEYNLIFPIVSKNYYGDEDLFVSLKLPIGTGMYKISSADDNVIVLQKNDNWVNLENQKVLCENVYIYLFKSMGEIYNGFKIGNIDFISTDSTDYSDYIGTIDYAAKEYKGREVDFISMNCNDNILVDKNVRKAINYAIDKNNIVTNIFNNKNYISEYPIDYGTYLYKNYSSKADYNIEQAKIMLQEAGWVNNNNQWVKDGKSLNLNIMVNATNQQRCLVADSIKQQLEEIGIKVNIKKISDEQYSSYLQNKNYQIIITGVRNGFDSDVSYFYGNGNLSNYNNEEVKSIIDEIKNITDEKILMEKYKRIIEITKEEVPYICLYRNKRTVLVKQNAGGQIVPNNYNSYNYFWSWHRD